MISVGGSDSWSRRTYSPCSLDGNERARRITTQGTQSITSMIIKSSLFLDRPNTHTYRSWWCAWAANQVALLSITARNARSARFLLSFRRNHNNHSRAIASINKYLLGCWPKTCWLRAHGPRDGPRALVNKHKKSISIWSRKTDSVSPRASSSCWAVQVHHERERGWERESSSKSRL